MFTQSNNHILLSHIKECKCFKNVIHQIDSKNEWLLLSASFTAKCVLIFVLTLENVFSFRGFILNATEKAWILLKNGTRDFQKNPLFKRSACFYGTFSEHFERFQYFNFKTYFRENENPFQQNGVTFIR